MLVLQLVGQGAFILASLLLGVKLIGLWRRTREVSELTIGLSFLLGGGLGFLSWFVLAVVRALHGSEQTLHAISLFGLLVTALGTFCLGEGLRRIYRPREGWPVALIGATALVTASGWVGHCFSGRGGMAFWVAIAATLPTYLWGAAEAFLLGRVLHKRARLGLADPAVVNRLVNWGIAASCVVVMVGLSVGTSLRGGVEHPAWISALIASIGLVTALAIWLGFFPPRGYLQRVARAYEGA